MSQRATKVVSGSGGRRRRGWWARSWRRSSTAGKRQPARRRRPGSAAPHGHGRAERAFGLVVPVLLVVTFGTAAAYPPTSPAPVQQEPETLALWERITRIASGDLGDGPLTTAIGPRSGQGATSGLLELDFDSMPPSGQASPDDVPRRALDAYLQAALLIGTERASCRLPWTALAAIGRVETDHGTFGGSTITATGATVPPILGLRLDGSSPGISTVTDTDKGFWDGDQVYDRALGPMQILPATWATYAADGDGDGRRDPQDIDDAALAAARYLCAADGDLSTPEGLATALYRYNPSTAYVSMVLQLAHGYAVNPGESGPGLVAPPPGWQPPAGWEPWSPPGSTPATTPTSPRTTPSKPSPAKSTPPTKAHPPRTTRPGKPSVTTTTTATTTTATTTATTTVTTTVSSTTAPSTSGTLSPLPECPTPTPSSGPGSPTPTVTPTPTGTATPTAAPSPTTDPAATPTVTPTVTPSLTPTGTPTTQPCGTGSTPPSSSTTGAPTTSATTSSSTTSSSTTSSGGAPSSTTGSAKETTTSVSTTGTPVTPGGSGTPSGSVTPSGSDSPSASITASGSGTAGGAARSPDRLTSTTPAPSG